ncbi:BREX-2 system phosphatase PglZ, partial [bacterium]|nr:BREX-2 system phosphatase PglZ [bacterium]
PRLERVEPWRMVAEHFGAESLDPRLSTLAWLPQAMQHLGNAGAVEPSSGSRLGLEHVWTELLALIGVPRGPVTVESLVEVDGQRARRLLMDLPEDLRASFQHAVQSELARVAGHSGAAIGRLWGMTPGESPGVVGIAIDALLRSPERDAVQAGWIRLVDQGVVDRQVDRAFFQDWADAAVSSARSALETTPESFHQTVQKAERFLDAVLKVPECGRASRVLAAGLARGRTELVDAIDAMLESPADAERRTTLANAVEAVVDHVLGASEVESLAMVGRVARGLGTPDPTGLHLNELSIRYRDDLAWLERACDPLAGGHGQQDLNAAVKRLAVAVRKRLRDFSGRFGEAVVSEFAGGRGPFLPLEEVMGTVVDPLVKAEGGGSSAGKVLVIVMDGMSWPVALRVFEEIGRRSSLRRLTSEPSGRWRPVVSPLPSVTQVARASLIAGRLTQGGQGVEQQGLRDVAERYGWKDDSNKDQVLHKDALDAGARKIIGLASSVVVAVVNAVDDQLKTGGQLRPDWSLDQLPILKDLLDTAEFERRSIVVVADHGHIAIADGEPKHRSEEGGERWRSAADPPGDGEIRVEGDRVVLPTVGGPIIVPSDDRVRYAARSAGHHGGASPQEMICPLAVFVPSTVVLGDQWIQESTMPPAWWAGESAETPSRISAPTTVVQSDSPGDGLGATPETSESEKEIDSGTTTSGWIATLLATELFESQRKSAGRRPPDVAKVQQLLSTIDSAGGTVGMDELASRMQTTRVRLQGVVVTVSNILNIDGYPVLASIDGGQQVRLDAQLACRQFEVEGSA